jgi:hypothetical protein
MAVFPARRRHLQRLESNTRCFRAGFFARMDLEQHETYERRSSAKICNLSRSWIRQYVRMAGCRLHQASYTYWLLHGHRNPLPTSR